MTEEQIKNVIYERLQKHSEHIINRHLPYDYYNEFWTCVSLLCKGGVLTTKKDVDMFCTKMQLNKVYDNDKCIQGLSEMMFWIYAVQKEYQFELDKQLNIKENNHSDIDIQIVKDGIKYNIEIKTPVQSKMRGKSVLGITIPFRSIALDGDINKKCQEVIETLAQQVVDNSEGKYTSFEKNKINDNKILEYLRSGQKKFTNERDSVNVLALCVPSSEMNDYWSYLCNPCSGIFTEEFEGRFRDSDGKTVTYQDFDKVDVIYLNNIVQGHLNCLLDFEAWKLENYCGVFFINPYSRRTMEMLDVKAYEGLLKILHNDTIQFNDVRKERLKQLQPLNISVDPIMFSEYLHDYYYKLWLN